MNKFLAMGIASLKLLVFSMLLTVIFQSKLSAQVCSPSYNNPWQWGPHSTWFFGEGVFLNFPGGVGAPVLSYKPVMGDDNRGYEGTAAINDNAGTLLAYSNGRSLWQANASLIANNLLAGNEGGSVGQRSSAVQGIVAVRHPVNPSKIYIFTSDDALTNANVGVNYTILDLNTMTSSAPVRLKDDLGNDYRSTEQVEATFHANGRDVWLVVRQSGNGTSANFQNFYAYSLTCSGLNSVPVKSVAGPPVKGSWTQNWERGALKFSWDGTKAVAVNHVNDWTSYDEAISVYDFNNASGILSDGKAVAGNWGGFSWSGATYEAMYDCEWAPDSKGIYIVPAGGTARLLWMDASLATANAIYSSIKVVTNTVAVPGDLKLGGDGRLYQATFNNTLNTYSFPSAADMNAGNNISVGTLALAQNSNLGLSNMFVPPIDYLDIQNPVAMDCNDAAVNLAVNWFCRGTNAEDPVGNPNGWSSNCGACITDAANGIFNPVIAGQGTHEVYYSYGAACPMIDTLTIVVGPCGGCLDTTLAPSIPAVCSTNGTINLTLYKGTAAAGSWSIVSGGGTANITGGNTFNINNTPAGNYVVQYTVAGQGGGCGNNPQRTIVVNRPTVTLTLTDDAACINEGAFNLSGGSPGGGNYSGTGVGVSPSFNPTTAGLGPHTITYSYTDGILCTATATHVLTVNDTTPVTFNLPDDQICINEGNLTLTGGLPGGGTYLGTGVTVSPTFNPATAGAGDHFITYTYTNGSGCTTSAADTMTVNPLPTVTLVLGDNAACIDEAAFALGGGSPLGGTYSGNGVSGGSFDPANPGGSGAKTITYTYTDPSTGCSDFETATLTVNDLPIVSLADAKICPGGNIILAPAPNVWTAHTWSTGSNNDTIHYNIPNTAVWVDVTDANGCAQRATANISVGDTLHVDFGADKTICSYQTVTLDAAQYGPFQAPVTYTWDDLAGNNQPSSRTLNQAGDYGVLVMDGAGCAGSDTVNIDVNVSTAVNLPADVNVCFTGKKTYTAQIPNIYASQLWSTGSVDTFALVSSVSEVIVTVTDNNNCVDSDTMKVGEYCDSIILCVPNVFTPNGDGVNDVFKPCKDKMKEINDNEYKSIMDNILDINFAVYDRWGVKMFQSVNVFPEWDGNYNGKKVSGGVYYWIITYTDSVNAKYELTGWAQLLD